MPPKKDFQWSDDETELLLNITHDYKVSKAAESVDWESVKSKYNDILELFKAELPSTNEEARNLSKDYPHTKDEVNKQVLTSKLKNIRQKYRQAVDSGRKTGHGRVVLLYFDLCERVWGGSPATEQIEGVESSDIMVSANGSGLEGSSGSNVTGADDASDEVATASDNEATEPAESEESTESTVQQRRELLDSKLKNYRHEKLKRKLPADIQLLDCAKEELQLKKKFIEQMDRVDKEYSDNFKRLTDNMEKMTKSIADGFSLLQGLLTPQPQPMYPPYQASTYSRYSLGERPSTTY